MSRLASLALTAVVALAAPAIASAQSQWGFSNNDPAYGEGYGRGQRAGTEDFRRGDRYDFIDESDYRNGERGYRSQYGSRDRYRDLFRRGFQEGYRFGYDAYGYQSGAPGRSGPPSWSRGRGTGRYDLAYQTGLNDGYEAGLNDARNRRRFDPISEGRYRDGDRGYERYYGAREAYKNNYRIAFREGYSRGFQDAVRYTGRPSWLRPF
jgi:hypothetical protein